MPHSDTIHNIFEQYIDICNKALAQNKDRFPYKQILAAAHEQNVMKQVEVCITDNPTPTCYVIRLGRDKVQFSNKEKSCTCNCRKKWIISKEYLNQVINNPQQHIENPAKINWEWLEVEDNNL